ncbi:putative ATP-grasp-modified RiPP [Streptomyces ipomoeae]|uniref:ATP-grasp-modified RiPP n=2 Tax=Streptomyces ipomoeae TaxID=103232 RepID=A0AAE9AW43_9ACTN|nr:putative ATP-grasp-modified RiPP [Streptomyces ipomoeae]
MVTTPALRPWGLTRMRPFPATAVLATATVILDPETQTGRWIEPDGLDTPTMARHKRSETSKETKPKTSLDGNTDEGSDQEGDTD